MIKRFKRLRLKKYFYWKDGSYIMEIGALMDELFENRRKDSSREILKNLSDFYV